MDVVDVVADIDCDRAGLRVDFQLHADWNARIGNSGTDRVDLVREAPDGSFRISAIVRRRP